MKPSRHPSFRNGWAAALATAVALVAMTASQPSEADTPHVPLPPRPIRSLLWTFTTVHPPKPCIGRFVTLTGHRYYDATKVSVWVYIPPPTGASAVPGREGYMLKLGQAPVDPWGEWDMTIALTPKLGSAATGGYLLLEPGRRLDLRIKRDAGGLPNRGDERVSVDIGAAGVPCPIVSLPPRPTLTLEPPHPCLSQPVTLRGAHFSGHSVPITFFREPDRTGTRLRTTREVPVDEAGTFTYRFTPDDIRDGHAPIIAGPEAYTTVSAYDADTHSLATLDVLTCADTFVRAMKAPSIRLADGVTGAIDLPKDRADLQPAFESFVVENPQDLKVAATRLGVPVAVFEKRVAIDYAHQVGLLVFGRATSDIDQLRIVGVEPTSIGYRVHTVQWLSLSAMSDTRRVFDFTVAPRTDLLIDFASPTRADSRYARSFERRAFSRNPTWVEISRGRAYIFYAKPTTHPSASPSGSIRK